MDVVCPPGVILVNAFSSFNDKNRNFLEPAIDGALPYVLSLFSLISLDTRPLLIDNSAVTVPTNGFVFIILAPSSNAVADQEKNESTKLPPISSIRDKFREWTDRFHHRLRKVVGVHDNA